MVNINEALGEVMDIVDKNTKGYEALDKLSRDLSYAAPEIKSSLFWGGTFNKDSIVDICTKYYSTNEKVYTWYTKLVTKYKAEGFTHEKNIAKEEI